MNIIIGNDHAAIDLKYDIINHLQAKSSVSVTDHVCEGLEYPDYALDICNKVVSGEYDIGILLCGTGVGMCMAANKVRSIRAVVCSEPFTAQMARSHNDANVLCIGARVIGGGLAKIIVDAFLDEPFAGGRHAGRVAKIMEIEKIR